MPQDSIPVVSFTEALDLGKYEPTYLAQYSEWGRADRQLQYQFIVRALQARRRNLRQQWAALANQLNFSEKPYLKEAQKKVEQALKELNQDEERLLVEYAGS